MGANFPPHKLRPMRPEQYRRLTASARELLARIDAECDPTPSTPAARKSLTTTIHRLARVVRELSSRHRLAVGDDGSWNEADPQ